MRIFYSPDGSDPMLLDTKAGLWALHEKLQGFLSSPVASAQFAAEIDRSPDPYDEFLPGLRLRKGEGAARLTLDADRWLTLEGSAAELADCVKRFLIKQENGHTHLYTTPVSLIIEADSTRGAEIAS